jgi:glycosyltransferase involved in cell wall biosynthesis
MNSDQRRVTISVIIPTYNRAELLCDAIDSVLSQTCPVSEIIVVDDGSTDDTVGRLKTYGTTIKYLNQRNQGPGAARNHGIRESKGDFITILDSDDIWVPQKLEIQLRFAEQNPGVDFIFGKMVNVFQDTGLETEDFIIPDALRYLTENASNLERLFELLISQNFIPTSTLMARREAVTRVGFFDEKRRIAEDLDYWLKAAIQSRWGFVDEVLIKRRRHSGNLISDWIKWNIAAYHVLEDTARPLSLLRQNATEILERRLRELNYDIGSAYFKQGRMKSAYPFLKRAEAQEFTPSLYGKLMVSWLLKICPRFCQ